MFDNNVFGQNLRQFCKGLGLYRQDFAAACDLSIYTIRSYLSGQNTPSTKSLIKICNAFAASPNTLLAGQFTHTTEQDTITRIENNLAIMSEEHFNFFQQIKNIFISEPDFVGYDFGMRLRSIRESTGIMRESLSKLCGISPGTISSQESSQVFPSVDTLLIYCENLFVSPEYLLCGNLKSYTPQSHPYLYINPRHLIALEKLTEFLLNGFFSND